MNCTSTEIIYQIPVHINLTESNKDDFFPCVSELLWPKQNKIVLRFRHLQKVDKTRMKISKKAKRIKL